ncbi:MAG: hypothetical protein ABI442_10565 [Gemmatimonadaceae bacterium]
MKPATVLSLLSFAALAVTLSACRPAGEQASADGSVANAKAGSLEGPTRGAGGSMMGSTGGMGSMGGTSGMSGAAGMTSGAGVNSMETSLGAMDNMSAAQIEAAYPANRQAAGDMLSRMGADMQGMHMSPNASWSATADSIRQDLSHMAGMTGAQMKAAMPAYHGRMTRLMGMHRQMMAKPKT